MQILIQYQKEIVIGLVAILGSIIAFSLSTGWQIISSKFQRGKEINKAISILLDLHDAYRAGSAVYMYDYANKLPASDRRNKMITDFETMAKNFIIGNKSQKLARIKASLNREIEILSQYAPIAAFKLRGLEETINDVHASSEDAIKSISELGRDPSTFKNGHIFIKAARINEKLIWRQIIWLVLRFRLFSILSFIWLGIENHNEYKEKGQDLLRDWLLKNPE
jgi:hypothetical protein